jgi:NDP-sugar pyrophosphorylase family protein
MSRRVLITTSGTGSRLNNLTKYTNKSLIQIGDRYAINYIIESYPIDFEFVITLGYFGENVKDFLELAYPNRNFIFVNVELYEGLGSSLGYSMLQAKKYLKCPFIFHCCDSITNPIYNCINYNDNVLFVKNIIDLEDNNLYSGINVKQNKVLSMNEKGSQINDFIYIGLCFIKDYENFWIELEKEYLLNSKQTNLSDIHAIQNMIKQNISFDFQIINEYNDTGNIKSYQKTCNFFQSEFNVLAKTNESICFLDNFVIKFINDENINRKRIKRAEILYPLTPKILDSKKCYIKMEFIKGELLSNCKDYNEINNLLEWAQQNLWRFINVNEKYKKCCYNFYKLKTLDRVSKIDFLDKEYDIINGVNVGKIFDLLNSIDYNFISTEKFSKFHGDFILDNIIKIEENKYCLLDWRHEFDDQMEYGDTYYDLSKLRHNIYLNHSNVLNDLYDINIKNNNVEIELKCNYTLINQIKNFDRFLLKYNYDIKKVKIITSLIWINMAPLYNGKLKEFLFYFGKLNLFLSMTEY